MAGLPVKVSKDRLFRLEVKENGEGATCKLMLKHNLKVFIFEVKDRFLISSNVYDILKKEFKGKELEELRLTGFDYRKYQR